MSPFERAAAAITLTAMQGFWRACKRRARAMRDEPVLASIMPPDVIHGPYGTPLMRAEDRRAGAVLRRWRKIYGDRS